MYKLFFNKIDFFIYLLECFFLEGMLLADLKTQITSTEMGQQLRAHNVHVENLGLGFHVRQFTTACNSNASELVATVWSLRVLHSHAQTHTYIYILIIKTRDKKLF